MGELVCAERGREARVDENAEDECRVSTDVDDERDRLAPALVQAASRLSESGFGTRR